MKKIFAKILLTFLVLTTCAEASTPGRFLNESGEVELDFESSGAKAALQESGRGLAIASGVFALIGLASGVDISDMLYHGQFIAFAVQLKGLDVNFTACAEGATGNSAKATCPKNQNEKVYTRWASYFNVFGLNLDILPHEQDAFGNNDVFAADVRLSRAVGTIVGILLLLAVLTGIQVLLFKATETEEEDYDKALEDAYATKDITDLDDEPKHKGSAEKLRDIQNVRAKTCVCMKRDWHINEKWPQIILPMFPIRYWFNYPYVQLKIWITFHFSLCCAALAGIGSNGGGAMAVGWIMLIFFCAPLPPLIYKITEKYLTPEDEEDSNTSLIRYVKSDLEDIVYSITGGNTYRDVDWENAKRRKPHYVKPWRKSPLVNKFGPSFWHIKDKRKYWIPGILVFNFLEAAFLTGAVTRGRSSIDGQEASLPDVVTILCALFYLFKFFTILIMRPHHKLGNTVISLLQCFHNLIIVMVTVIYVRGGVFNTQDIFKIETDGIEEMLVIASSVGCVVHILYMFMKCAFVWSRAYSSLSWEKWDEETDDHRRNNVKSGTSSGDSQSSFHGLTRQNSKVELPPMLRDLQQKNQSKPVESIPPPMQGNPMQRKKKKQPEKEIVAEKAEAPPTMTDLPEGWAPVSDPATGKTYYFNSITQETSWEKPTSKATTLPPPTMNDLPEGWAPVSDPVSGKTYYFNSITQATAWDKPTNGVSPLPAGWAAVQDPSSGREYYYNAGSGETNWTRPK